MKPAITFAKYLYNHGFESNLQIQKLLYIALGFYGAYHDKFLFDDPIEAWKWGPVIPNVYFPIKNQDQSFKEVDPVLAEDETVILRRVVNIYGNKAPYLLVGLTHEENTPWSKVYRPEVKNIKIEKKTIIDYYKDLLGPVNATVERMIQDDFKQMMKELSQT